MASGSNNKSEPNWQHFQPFNQLPLSQTGCKLKPQQESRRDCKRPQDPHIFPKQEPQLRAFRRTNGWNVLPAKLWAQQAPAWLLLTFMVNVVSQDPEYKLS